MKLLKYIEKYSEIIIVVLLIIVLFLYKDDLKFGMIEGFESTVANSVSAIEQKFNQAFGMINATNVEIKQNLKLKEYLNVVKGIDAGSDIVAKKNIKSGNDIIAQKNVTAEGNVNAKNNLNANKKICIGKTCLDENHLKLLTDGFKMKIVKGKRSGEFIHSHANNRLGPHGDNPAKFKLYKY